MTTPRLRDNPFQPGNDAAYQAWRRHKLATYPASVEALCVPVADPGRLTAAEHAALLACLRRANMAIYRTTGGNPGDRTTVRALGRSFGLERLDMNLRADEDSITSLRVVAESAGTHYIPYTDKALNWHTDGYYNRPAERVRAIVMHCAHAAAAGGENMFLDPEIAYLLLRDEDPRYVDALMQPEAMTIPANIEQGVELRPAQSGPVFSIEKTTGCLHMRYTARLRSIEWHADPVLAQAVAFLRELLDSDSAYIFRYRMQAGEGVICNNVLHGRTAFNDAAGQERLMYRARYHDRVRGTELHAATTGESPCSG